MGKSKPKAPPAPDPVKTAQAQSAANKEAVRESALVSQIGQDTPFGTVRFTGDIGSPDRRQVIELSPAGQRQMQQQNLLASMLGQRAIGAVGDLSGQRFNLEGLTEAPSSFYLGGLPETEEARTGGLQDSGLPYLRTSLEKRGNIDVRRNLNRSLLPESVSRIRPSQIDLEGQWGPLVGIPGSGDFGAERQRVEGALMDRAASRLEPRFEQEEARLEQSLANRGIPPGSEQWNQEMANFSMAKNDAYDAAMNQAIAAGGAEQSRLFGQALQARGQQFGEGTTRSQFGAQQQAQQYGQLMGQAQLANTLRQQLVGEQLSQSELQRAFRNMVTSEDLQRAVFRNQSRQQATGERSLDAQLQASALQQQMAAREQAIRERQLQMGTTEAARQREIQERLMLRQQPMNELAAILQGSPAIGMPQAQAPGGFNVAPADVMGATQMGYQGALNRYNADLANQQSFYGGLGQLGGSVLGAAGMAGGFGALFSDRRLKTNIRRIGTADNGLGVYSFNYVWGGPTHVGYMADEVQQVAPDAVFEVAGYKAVDYSKV